MESRRAWVRQEPGAQEEARALGPGVRAEGGQRRAAGGLGAESWS